jgi:hypothetical protein
MEQSISQKKYSFPVEQILSNDYLKENFWKCLYTSCDKQLHYWVILPNNVKPTKVEPIEIDVLNMINIGQYTRIDGSPYLEVQLAYEHSKYEMNASDWLKNKLAKMNEEILEERIIYGKSTGNYLDCLCKKQINGETVISRYTVLKDYDNKQAGANYICIKATCQEKDYEELSMTIFQIISNWDLLNKSDWQMAELLTPFMTDFMESIKFFLPSSWEIKFNKENNNSISRFIFKHTIENKNKGILNAFFYEKDKFKSAEDVLNNSINRFDKIPDSNLDLSPLQQIPHESVRNPKIYELFYTKGLIQLEENFNAYIEIYIIKTFKGWYYFEMVGSKPNFENFYYEVNKRCIELIISSFNNMEFKIFDNRTIDPSSSTDEGYSVYKTINGKNFTKEEWEKFEEEEYKKYVEKRSDKKTSFLADEEIEKKNFSAENGTLKEVQYFVMNSKQDKVPVYEFPSAMVAPFTFLESGTAVDIIKDEKDGWCEVLSKDGKTAFIQSNFVKKSD